jgi:predicted TIM-barrel fold metal-dependent hydrolase
VRDDTGLTAFDLDWIVSVDDHVIEPPRVWLDRLPRKYHDVAPRIVTEPDGQEFWVYEDRRTVTGGLGAVAGRRPEDITVEGFPYSEMRPGCYDPQARLADMDEAGILASLNFPSIPRFCGQLFLEAKDKDLARLCVRAYNDWMIDEWCAGDGRGRLIPLAMVPLWDPQLAADEVSRCAAKGCHAITFSENPYPLGLPSIHSGEWDPLFAACVETETVLCMHIGSSSKMPGTTPDAPFIVSSTLTFQNAMGSLLDFVFSGTLARFPELVVAYSEGQVGWMPYLLERMDKLWEERSDNSIGTNLPEPPTSYIRGRVYGCIFDDETGLANRDRIGMDTICFETDYPHADSTFPHSEAVAEGICRKAGLDDDETYKLLRGNAIRAFGLERFGITR